MDAFKIPALPDLLDLDEIDRRFKKNEAWSRETLTRPEGFEAAIAEGKPLRFNTLSLPGWLEIARLAGVPHIPAREIHAFSVDEFVSSLDGGNTEDAHEDKILNALQPGEMLRMEQVAPAEIKHQRSAGQEIGNGAFYSSHFGKDILNLAEDRFYTTLRDLGEDQVRAYARPISPVRKVKGKFRGEEGAWPEEYRVFVKDGMITGISNYYPQVALKPGDSAARMDHAVYLAERMLRFMQDHAIINDNAKYRSGETITCTLDFLVNENKEVLFLEGGPEGLVAAHPCCFIAADGHLKRDPEGNELSGAVFSEAGPVFPLEDLKAMQKKEVVHVSIDYTEGDPDSYRGVIAKAKSLKAVFSTGDPQQDWADHTAWAERNEILAVSSSSVGHFCWDVPGWRFIEDEMGREMLVPEDRPEWADHAPEMG